MNAQVCVWCVSHKTSTIWCSHVEGVCDLSYFLSFLLLISFFIFIGMLIVGWCRLIVIFVHLLYYCNLEFP